MIDHGQGNGPASYEDATKTPQTTQIGKKQPKSETETKTETETETTQNVNKTQKLFTMKRFNLALSGYVQVLNGMTAIVYACVCMCESIF